MKCLVLDGTEDSVIYEELKKYVDEEQLDVSPNRNVVYSRIENNLYDLIVLSDTGFGERKLFDVAHLISKGRMNKKSSVILIFSSPANAARITSLLRGRELHKIKMGEQNERLAILLGGRNK